MTINVASPMAFDLVTRKIWSIIGVRLLEEVANRIRSGSSVKLCGLTLDKRGIELPKYGLSYAIVPWENIRVSSFDGKLEVRSRKDRRRKKVMKFRFTDDAPILFALIRNKRSLLVQR